MRALGIFVAFGLVLAAALGIGAKRLDEIASARHELVLRAGGESYFIPSQFVRDDGWRTNLLRAGGCWDARDAAMLAGMASFAGCDRVHRVHLVLPAALLGPDVFHQPQFGVDFWPSYQPPAEELSELGEAWRGRGHWAARSSIWRADWRLWRIETPASPWVYLLTSEPRTGEGNELAQLYAGRCYRPEHASDAGMTCAFALHVGMSAVLEFSLGADEVMSFAMMRDALIGLADRWREAPAVAVSESFGPSA